MATYTVTTSNWNDAVFWTAINESGIGHTLDFSGLPSTYTIDIRPGNDEIIISDGTTSFTIGDSDHAGTPDATMGGTTQLDFFTTVLGGQGKDRIEGGANADTLFGGVGNDTILGGAGADSLDGGDGADTFILADNFRNDTISGGSGGSDNDLIDLSGLTGPVTVTYTGDQAGTITNGTDTITFNDIERLILTDGADMVDASADSVGINVYGTSGNDSLLGGTGDDTIFGGDDEDTIDGGSGNDHLEGGWGSDTILGGDGNDYIEGNDHVDSLDGGAGDDTMLGGRDYDILYGGDGDDVMYGDGEGISEAADTLYGGAGNDTLYAVEGPIADDGSELYGEAGDDSLVGGVGKDSLSGGVGADALAGGDNDDTLLGDAGDDRIDGGSGDDSLLGGDGTDTFILNNNSGVDTIAGGEVGTDQDILNFEGATTAVDVTFSGDDQGTYSISGSTVSGTFDEIEGIEASGFNDTITASSATDNLTINAGAGNDSVVGGGADDTIDGGQGSDTLSGEGGDDSLTGGDLDDVFEYNAGDGNDTITDFNTGNTGALGDGDSTNNDFIDLSSFYSNINELRADFDDNGQFDHSNSGSADYSDNTSFGGGAVVMQGASSSSEFTTDNTGVTCFTIGTAIRTPRGEVLIEHLRIGDLVDTADNGPQPIRWIGIRALDHAALNAAENLRPVLIKPDVLGNTRPMLVSQQHGLLIGGNNLVRAKNLATRMPGVRIAYGKRSVTYLHLMFDAHQIIFAENAPAESFYPGPIGMKMMGDKTRAELFSIFPELKKAPNDYSDTADQYGETARRFLANRDLEQVLTS